MRRSAMRAAITGILATLCLSLLPASALALGTLDQSYEESSDLIAGASNNTVAQTFTAGATGLLDTIALEGVAGSCSGSTPTVQIRLVTSAGHPVGDPADTSGVLAQEDNVACVVGFYNITFANPAFVVAGQKYAIVWGNADIYHYYKPGGTYSGGDACGWIGTTWNCGDVPEAPFQADWLFRTYVTDQLGWPDARIKRAGGPVRGSNIYNLDASGQAVSAKDNVGDVRRLYVSFRNNGLQPAAFTIGASGAEVEGFDIRYFRRKTSTEITSQVEAGTFTTPVLVPGQVYRVRVRIEVFSCAPKNQPVNRLIAATSVTHSNVADTVRFVEQRSARGTVGLC